LKINWFSWFFRWKRGYGLKARLRNYLLFETYLDIHDKAKKVLAGILSRVDSNQGRSSNMPIAFKDYLRRVEKVRSPQKTEIATGISTFWVKKNNLGEIKTKRKK
jgi:hypothetical protein